MGLKDLTFTLDGNPDIVEELFNFRKIRLIHDVLDSCFIEQPEKLSYSHLETNFAVTHAIVSVS